jgi:hypothetical protein
MLALEQWTLERGLERCRALQRIVEPFAFSVALYGGVLVNGIGHDRDVFLVPQRADAGVAACVEAIHAGLNCGVTGPFLGDWNRLMCQIRVRPDCIDAQFTRLTAPPGDVAVRRYL